MARKTFEQLIKPYLQSGLQALLNSEHTDNPKVESYTLKLTNDLRHSDAKDTRIVIPGCITTGEVARATARDVLQYRVPVSMDFLVESNFVQDFVAIINTYCFQTHRFIDSVTDSMETDSTADDVEYNYYFDWRSAKPAGDPFVRDLKSTDPLISRESVSMQLVHLSGDVYYGIGQIFQDTHLFIEVSTLVNGVPTPSYQEIIAIQELGGSLEPAFNSTLLVEDELPKIDYVGDTHKKAVRVYRVPGDPVQDHIIGLQYTNRSATSFDAKVKITVSSISISAEYNAKLANIQQNKLGDTEYLSFSMTLLDPVS